MIAPHTWLQQVVRSEHTPGPNTSDATASNQLDLHNSDVTGTTHGEENAQRPDRTSVLERRRKTLWEW